MLSTYLFLLDFGYDTEAAKQKAAELKPNLKNLLSETISFTQELKNFSSRSGIE